MGARPQREGYGVATIEQDPDLAPDTAGHASVDTAVSLMRRVSLFQDLDHEELTAMARRVRRRHCPKGTLILAQDEPGTVGFLIVDGAVDVLLESEDGRQFIVAQFGPGDHFGEMALLDAEPRSATVVATADTELLVLRRDEFIDELMRHPRTMLRMMTTLSRRLRRADAQVASLAFGDTAARLARLLIANGQPGPRGLAIEVAQDDLAAMVGATRQTVGRIFSAWRRQGFIATGRRHTVILNREALDSVARM